MAKPDHAENLPMTSQDTAGMISKGDSASAEKMSSHVRAGQKDIHGLRRSHAVGGADFF